MRKRCVTCRKQLTQPLYEEKVVKEMTVKADAPFLFILNK